MKKTPLHYKLQSDLDRDLMYENLQDDGIDLNYYMDKPIYLAPLSLFYSNDYNPIQRCVSQNLLTRWGCWWE